MALGIGVEPCCEALGPETGGGLGPLWAKCPFTEIQHSVAGPSRVPQPPGAEGSAEGGESYREIRAVWRGLSEASGPSLSFLPLCRPPGNQGYSRFPPVAEGTKGQTGQKWGNPRLNPSVCPAGPDSLRLDGRRLEGRKPAARPALLPLRKVSLGGAD